MCLILFAWQTHPRYPLIIAANRDEFYQRPTQNGHFWEDHPDLFAGRDLEADGTWMGFNNQGRFAAITNYREPGKPPGERSRGLISKDLLTKNESLDKQVQQVSQQAKYYSGFNLLAGDEQSLWYCSSHQPQPMQLQPGIYGLSNALLDSPWPKVDSGKAALKQVIQAAEPEPAALFQLLADTTTPEDKDLPDTGVGLELERLLASRFIASEHYGTRTSTVILRNQENQVQWYERWYAEQGTYLGEQQQRLEISRKP